MQAELLSENPDTAIRILGVNAAGYESGNASICQGRTIPWLQDTGGANVWGAWGVVFRDVRVLDRENRLARTYNLTDNDLADPVHYEILKNILKQVAGE
ncbi:MAG: hypothetical protein HY716_16025 [Planctomycetes bacterium]|nr:hypothetical protein [Planctomycetota bacterium]